MRRVGSGGVCWWGVRNVWVCTGGQEGVGYSKKI